MKNFLERVQENGPAGRTKYQTERVGGLGRRTREKIVKWNQMTALRDSRQGGDVRHPRPPFGMSQRPPAVNGYVKVRNEECDLMKVNRRLYTPTTTLPDNLLG